MLYHNIAINFEKCYSDGIARYLKPCVWLKSKKHTMKIEEGEMLMAVWGGDGSEEGVVFWSEAIK
jgi:hypothetical protein